MTDQNLFSDNAAATTAPITTQTAPQPAIEDQLLATIVNEHGQPKYSSVPDALKALTSSQEHIKRIEAENAALREAQTKAVTMEALLKAIKPSEPVTAPVVTATNTEAPDLINTVKAVLAQEQEEKLQKANQLTVVEKVKEAFGDKANEVFYQKAKELGFSALEINALSAKNPSAVLKLLGITEKAKPSVSPLGVRTDGFPAPTPQAKGGAMSLSSSKDLVENWRRVGNDVKAKLGITN